MKSEIKVRFKLSTCKLARPVALLLGLMALNLNSDIQAQALRLTTIEDAKGSPVKNIWDAFIKLPNDGKSLVERFEIPGTSSHHTDLMSGQSETYIIPAQAQNIIAGASSHTGLVWAPTMEIFTKAFESPPQICFKTYGTTLNPAYSNDCR